MVHYEYHRKSQDVLMTAKSMYPGLIDELITDEGIEARYHLLGYLQNMYNYNGTLLKNADGTPIPLQISQGWIFWSLSHTVSYTAFIVSDIPIGIDISEVRHRDESLMSIFHEEEYDMIGDKNWKSFYILWTTKEALIKKLYRTMDDMRNMSIKEYHSTYVTLYFQEKEYIIHFIEDKQLILAYG